jgi:hypothetical protein
MKLPGAPDAIVEIEKLSDYSFSPDHPVGKHKARVFEASLGLRREHAVEMQNRLLAAARTYDCTATKNRRTGSITRWTSCSLIKAGLRWCVLSGSSATVKNRLVW